MSWKKKSHYLNALGMQKQKIISCLPQIIKIPLAIPRLIIQHHAMEMSQF